MTIPDPLHQAIPQATSGDSWWPYGTTRPAVVGRLPADNFLVSPSEKVLDSSIAKNLPSGTVATDLEMPPLNSTFDPLFLSNSTLGNNQADFSASSFPTLNTTTRADDLSPRNMANNSTLGRDDSILDSGNNSLITPNSSTEPLVFSDVTTLFPGPGVERTGEGGLTSMEIWFLVTGCIIALVIVLLFLNCFIQYKEKVAKQVKKMQPDGRRVTGEAARNQHEDEKNVQTHIFYHPFFHRGDDHSSHSNRL